MYGNDNVTRRETETDAEANDARGFFWGSLGVLAFSLSTVVTRAAAPELGALWVGLGRPAVAGLLAAAVLLASRARLPERRHWPGLVRVAAFSGIGFPVLAALAMTEISASRALVMTALLPMCTAVWGSFVEGSRQPPRFWAAGLGATALVVAYTGTAGTPGWPEAAMGAGMLMSAVGYTDGARLTRELGGLRAWCWALVVAEGVALPLWAGVTWAHPPSGSAGAWLAFGYMAGVSSFLGFVAWYKGMALGGIARTSQLQSVQPMIGLIWAALLLGEPLTLRLCATALGVAGLVAWGRRRGRADRVRAAGTARERL